MYENKTAVYEINELEEGKVGWRSPSNIALVKYWGKFGRQYPQNPSISFTLSSAYTDTIVNFKKLENNGENISLDFTFEGQRNEAFRSKMVKFLASITDIFPFLNQLHFSVESRNSFPHSSGIASSASSMSALAMCLCNIEQQLSKDFVNSDTLLQKASYVSRLGSGSACRSVYPSAAIWGKATQIEESSNDFAIPANNYLHPVFRKYQDAILIVSREEKKVSSRAGHALMDGNPYANTRYKQANAHLTELLDVLKMGDLDKFVEIVEAEALILHALMMCSKPSYLLMRPNTLQIIEKIRAFREDSGIQVCFTLDAGPNVHVLYPEKDKQTVNAFIKSDLQQYCEDGYWIADSMGSGPEKLPG